MRVTHSATTAPIGEAEWLADHVIEGEVAGPKGDTGATGPQGETGSTGPAGAQGETGPAGPQGQQGPAGNDGADGATGAAGPEGQQGAQGEVGPQGPKGDTGDTGPQGSSAVAWPIGSVFLSVVSTNPATLLGFGTWSAFGAGRLLVGNDGGTFGTDEATGGASTASAVVNHTHPVTDPGHVHAMQRFPTATGGSTGFTVDTSMSGTPAAANDTASKTTGITTSNPAGGVASFSILPPYIVVHMWKRTA